MTPQERYWRRLTELKTHSLYINLYQMKTEGRDRWINGFLAVASSSSIGGWAVFRDYAFVWGCIIALSQVITAIKDHLPYRRRLKPLSGLSHDLARLLLCVEHDWFDVSEGKLTNPAIQKKITGIRTQLVDLMKKHFESQSLPPDQTLMRLAESEAASYFSSHYGIIPDGAKP